MRPGLNILVISHAHPMESTGGAEIAAYNLFLALKGRPDCAVVSFLAGSPAGRLHPGAINLVGPDQYLWKYGPMDWFRLRSGSPQTIVANFREFLKYHRPDIVFVHHYAHLGVDIFREIKGSLPNVKIVLTLHEYLAICNRNGQMLKNGSRKLCYSESIYECHACFPEYSEEDFWLRKHFIQRSFEQVDLFISPSRFLMDRYNKWGIPREFSKVIENGQKPISAAEKPTSVIASKIRLQVSYHNRFGYFGQATEYKGIEVFLRAIHALPPATRRSMLFEVHCANLEQQGDWFKALLNELRTPLQQEGVLRWVGPYDHNDLPGRMSKIGWVVVPSTWWENSPMVIQEAFHNKRPVICSDIGGMAEKVRNGIDGIHFAANNPIDLAETMINAANGGELWAELQANISSTMSLSQYGDEYLNAAIMLL